MANREAGCAGEGCTACRPKSHPARSMGGRTRGIREVPPGQGPGRAWSESMVIRRASFCHRVVLGGEQRFSYRIQRRGYGLAWNKAGPALPDVPAGWNLTLRAITWASARGRHTERDGVGPDAVQGDQTPGPFWPGRPFALSVPGRPMSRAGLTMAVSITTHESLYRRARVPTTSVTRVRWVGSLG